MSERPDTDIAWDEVVDVVCVGSSPGVLAYAICCLAADLDVVLVRPAGEPDPQTAAWYAAMTEDLSAPKLNAGREITAEDRRDFSLARLVPVPKSTGKRVTLEPFIGEHLRQWSAHCAQSAFGVMFTQVPDLLVPMRTEDGESVTAALIGDFQAHGDGLEGWLQHEADEMDLLGTENVLAAMVLEGGRIAGVHLDDGSLIAANGGLAFPVGDAASRSPIPPGPIPPDVDDLTVAVLGRPAGRFATVDLLRR